MQFLFILAVVATLVVAEAGPSQPVSGAGLRLAVAVGGMALVALYAAVASGWTARRLRRDYRRRFAVMKTFRAWRRGHVVLWLAVTGGILCWLDWARLVRFNWHLDRVFLVDELLILTPALLPMVLSWAAFYEVERALDLGGTGVGEAGVKLATRGQYLSLHVRHYLGILMIPVLGLLALEDAVELLLPDAFPGEARAALYVLPMASLFVLFPVLLRRVWETGPLAGGPLRDRLEATAGRAGFRLREILVWQTRGMAINAAVAGFCARVRYVFLTDGLLAHLADEEVEAVFGHEVGHVRHHHMTLRLVAMIAPLSLWLLVQQAFPGAIGRMEASLFADLEVPQLLASLATLAAVAAYVLIVFGAYSKLLESQADLFACRVLGCDSAADARGIFVSALEKLAEASGIDPQARSWQHASIARRIDFLQKIGRAPRGELRFQRWVRCLNILVLTIASSPLAYWMLCR
jgi:STE24 endopeptidase